MIDSDATLLATKFLIQSGIGYEEPVEKVIHARDWIEVVFPALGSKDSCVAVVDPPDVRVRVFTSGKCDLVYQM